MLHRASKSYRAGRMRESNAAWWSTYAVYAGLLNSCLCWANCTELGFCQWLNSWEWIRVAHLIQASRVGLIRESITCMNTLPGTKSSDSLTVLVFRPRALALIDRNNYALVPLLRNCRRFTNLSEQLFQDLNQGGEYTPEISHRHQVTSLTWSSLLPDRLPARFGEWWEWFQYNL